MHVRSTATVALLLTPADRWEVVLMQKATLKLLFATHFADSVAKKKN